MTAHHKAKVLIALQTSDEKMANGRTKSHKALVLLFRLAKRFVTIYQTCVLMLTPTLTTRYSCDK